MEEQKWENLPEHIVVGIFSYLKLPDRLSASLACKQWQECFHSPVLWQTFLFKFVDSVEFKYGKFLENHGQYLRRVEIHCKQDEKINRESACTLIRMLSGIKVRRLEKFVVKFIGENPLICSTPAMNSSTVCEICSTNQNRIAKYSSH